jgi:RNA polymerase sigma-70 factor (ECF subfamily)
VLEEVDSGDSSTRLSDEPFHREDAPATQGRNSTAGADSADETSPTVVYACVVMARDMDDDALVDAANNGDLQAYEELYHRHGGWVTSLARRLTGSDQDSLDVLQETFEYLWAKLPGLRLTSTVRAFLYPVIKHKSVDVLRRRRREASLNNAQELRAEQAAASAPRQSVEFRDMVKGLPPEQREVVVLRFAYDFRLAEIAEALGIPVGTVKSRLHNALVELRRSHSRK